MCIIIEIYFILLHVIFLAFVHFFFLLFLTLLIFVQGDQTKCSQIFIQITLQKMNVDGNFLSVI